jgi:PAS domain S-box-containing protein
MPHDDTPKSRLSAVARYALALLCVAVALAATFLLQPNGLVVPLFFLAIILSAWFGGMGAGLVAALLSTVFLDYFFLPPIYSLKFDPAHLPQLLVFFISAVLVSSWSAVRKRAERLLRRARDEQEAKVQERTADLRQANEQLQTEVTERQRVEETLRQRADLLDLTHDTIFARDMDDVITYWNRGAEELYGWKRDEAIGKVSHELTETIFPAPLEEINETLLRTSRWEGELIHAKRDGTRVVVASRWSLQRSDNGKAIAILETNNNITERKRAEETLRERAGLLDLTHDTIFARNMNDVITYWNRGAEELYGWKEKEALGKVTHQLMRTLFPAPLEEIDEVLLRTGRWEGELIHTKRDGAQVVVASRWSLLRDEDGEPVAILETNNDITEHRRAQDALRESEQRYRYIFDAAGVSIWEQDFSAVKAALDKLKASGVDDLRKYVAAHAEFVREAIPLVRVIDVNQATLELFEADNKAELLESLDKIFLPETEKVFAGELIAIDERRTSFYSETTLQTLKGRSLTVLFCITFPVAPATFDSVLVTITDITERKHAEEALHKTQAELAHVARVTTMGELTSSIAHEVNQPLAAIVTSGNACIRWLSNNPPNVEEAKRTVARIVNDGHRASEVVARVRAFFKKATPEKQKIDINSLIEDVISMVEGELRINRVQVRTELAGDLPAIVSDPIQLQQVLINLIINGSEAMSAVKGRRELVIKSEEYGAGTVLVAVQDSGPGFDQQNATELFNAFFTTKPAGLGMGLSISRSTIENYGGRLWATTGDRGATFQFTLPTSD